MNFIKSGNPFSNPEDDFIKVETGFDADNTFGNNRKGAEFEFECSGSGELLGKDRSPIAESKLSYCETRSNVLTNLQTTQSENITNLGCASPDVGLSVIIIKPSQFVDPDKAKNWTCPNVW